MIIPSIDLLDGKAVQLRQGNENQKIIERKDVLDLARDFSRFGEIAVIDLNAAFGRGDNLKLIKKICEITNCRVGGGIRTIEKAEELLRAGARKIIIGTKASPKFLKQLPKERLIAAIDTKDGFVVDNGWINTTNKKPEQKIKELERYCCEFLFTDVDNEGLMNGINLEKIKQLKNLTCNKITAAGGITTLQDIQNLEELNCNSQLGMALYTGKISLSEAFVSLLNFEKNQNKQNSLIPTIVQDQNGTILMLAYSSRKSLLNTFETNKATYFSRSRNMLWVKGEISGNYQEFIKARYDCDRDTILFTVKQTNAACHTNLYSCFESEEKKTGERTKEKKEEKKKQEEEEKEDEKDEKEFNLPQLYDVISDRIKNPKKESYTSKISKSEKKILEKIKEESKEVLSYTDKDNLIWEIADLTYFIMVLMVKKGITLNDVNTELYKRNKEKERKREKA